MEIVGITRIQWEFIAPVDAPLRPGQRCRRSSFPPHAHTGLGSPACSGPGHDRPSGRSLLRQRLGLLPASCAGLEEPFVIFGSSFSSISKVTLSTGLSHPSHAALKARPVFCREASASSPFLTRSSVALMEMAKSIYLLALKCDVAVIKSSCWGACAKA